MANTKQLDPAAIANYTRECNSLIVYFLRLHPLPWAINTNLGNEGDQPAFPNVIDSTGRPHGENIVCSPLGESEETKGCAAFIVQACNSFDRLTLERAELITALRDIVRTCFTPAGKYCDNYLHLEQMSKAEQLLTRLES